MEWLDALILGIVQGLAEYLPISSSGHLEIFREILGIDLPADKILQFDLIVHAATVCSTIVVLWGMFSKLCRSFLSFRRDENFYLVWKIVLSCIPIAIVGFFFKDFVEEFFGDGLLVVGICLIITAALLIFAHISGMKKGGGMVSDEKGRDITWVDAFIIGCSQAVAVLPGLSRSGTTIATGILLGDKREKVAYFSFLMVIIPIVGEALLDLKEIISNPAAQGDNSAGVLALVVGFVSSFIVGCCACKWMISLVKRGNLQWFALYCVVMGVICLLWR